MLPLSSSSSSPSLPPPTTINHNNLLIVLTTLLITLSMESQATSITSTATVNSLNGIVDGINNNNQSLESRERKRKERLNMIKSSILSQLNVHLPDSSVRVHHRTYQVNQPCYLTADERSILSEIFTIIAKTPEGTIDVDQLTTNQLIIDKIQGLRSNSWTCVKKAIFASGQHQHPLNLNSINSTNIISRSIFFPINSSSSPSTASVSATTNNNNIGHHLFDQSSLSNISLNDYQNDNKTQQHILEQRQRKRQERLIYIQNQVLSRLGLNQRVNETLEPCKLTDSERALVNQIVTKSSSTSSTLTTTSTATDSDVNTQMSNTVFTKLQGFYPSCKFNLIPLNNSISS